MQPMLHMQLVRNLVDYRMNPQEALDAPRWFIAGAGSTQSECDMRHSHVQLEQGFGGKFDGQQQLDAGAVAAEAEGEEGVVAAGLRARGHSLDPSNCIVKGKDRKMFGWGHIILRDPTSGVIWAGSEPRCDGCAVPAIIL